MKFILALIALCASSVAAQACAKEVAAVPACGTTCIDTAATGAGCASKDFKCYCSKQSSYSEAATKCVTTTCGADALKVKPATDAVCACAGK